MKKILMFVTLAFVGVVLALGAVGFWFWRSMGEPLYVPGMVRDGQNLRSPLEPPAQSTDESPWRVESDIELAYEAVGEGRPVLVIHGGPGFPYDKPWTGLDRLTDRYKFYYYHQRGCGDSTRPLDRFESSNFYGNMVELERTLGVGAQVADIERIRRILEQEQLLLIGHSFGGFIASMYAAEFPERVVALILVAPAGVLVLPNEETDVISSTAARLPAGQRERFQQIAKEYLDLGNVFTKSEAELSRINRQFGGFLLAAMGEQMSEPDATTSNNGGWMVQAMYFSMGARHDYRDALSAMKNPVLIVHGPDDDLVLAGSRDYTPCFPNASFHLLESRENGRAGHFVFNERPEEFAELVGEFLATVED